MEKVELVDFITEDYVVNQGYIMNNGNKKIIISTHGMTSRANTPRDVAVRKLAMENNLDYIGYSNRGSELIRYLHKKMPDGTRSKTIGGMSYEDPYDSYYDVKAVIDYAVKLGYEDIYLMGHSLGCTKTIYTINRLIEEKYSNLDKIKGIILNSLVDIPNLLRFFLKDKYDEYYKLAERKENEGNEYDLMPDDSFIHPISVMTYLKYTKYSKDLDFARYDDPNFDFGLINKINKPLFIRYGNVQELVSQNLDELVEMLNNKITIEKKSIAYIDGADHSYHDKEDDLAKEIIEFIKNI